MVVGPIQMNTLKPLKRTEWFTIFILFFHLWSGHRLNIFQMHEKMLSQLRVSCQSVSRHRASYLVWCVHGVKGRRQLMLTAASGLLIYPQVARRIYVLYKAAFNHFINSYFLLKRFWIISRVYNIVFHRNPFTKLTHFICM